MSIKLINDKIKVIIELIKPLETSEKYQYRVIQDDSTILDSGECDNIGKDIISYYSGNDIYHLLMVKYVSKPTNNTQSLFKANELGNKLHLMAQKINDLKNRIVVAEVALNNIEIEVNKLKALL